MGIFEAQGYFGHSGGSECWILVFLVCVLGFLGFVVVVEGRLISWS